MVPNAWPLASLVPTTLVLICGRRSTPQEPLWKPHVLPFRCLRKLPIEVRPQWGVSYRELAFKWHVYNQYIYHILSFSLLPSHYSEGNGANSTLQEDGSHSGFHSSCLTELP